MKNKKYLFSISLLISLLIILIPVALAKELDTYDNLAVKTKEQRINLYQSSEEEAAATTAEREPFERGYLSDPGKACVEQHEQTSKYANKLDSEVISILENIVSILYMICTVFSAIDTVIDALGLALGMWPECCWDAATGVGAAKCSAMSIKFRVWSVKYIPIQTICCLLNDGLCGLATCYGLGGANIQKITKIISLTGIRPKDSIYISAACLSPVGILYNLRKLKTVYQVYDCCIQEACENGLSTDACEKQLDEATCMYYEGSLYGIEAKVIMAAASVIIAMLIKELIKNAVLGMVLSCAYAILKLAQVPQVIAGVEESWKWVSKTFNEPTCKDLNFKDVKKDLEVEWEDVSLLDADNDGIYDTKETYNYLYADGSIKYNTVLYDSYEISGSTLTLNKESQNPITINLDEDKTAKDFFANSLDMNKEYELGKVQSVGGDTVAYEKGTVKVQKGTSTTPTTLTVKIGDKTTTETRYPNGDVLIQEENKWVYKTNEREKVLGILPVGEKISIEGAGTANAEELSQAIKQAQEQGIDLNGATSEIKEGVYSFTKGGIKTSVTKESTSQSETVDGIRIDRKINAETKETSVTLTKDSIEYDVPPEVLDKIGKENIKDIKKTIGEETIITYGDGKTANIKGDTTTFYNKDAAETGKLIRGKTTTEIQGDKKTDTTTVGAIKIKTEYEKEKTTKTTIEINGKIAEANTDIIEKVKTNQEEVVQAFNSLDQPDKLGYAEQEGKEYYFIGDDFAKSATTLQISDNGKKTTLTEWKKDPKTGKRIIEQKDTVIDKTTEGVTKETERLYDGTTENKVKSERTIEIGTDGRIQRITGIDEKEKNYNYEIDTKTGQTKNIKYGGLVIDTSTLASLKGQIQIYSSSSRVDTYTIGFDNNGDMWLKDDKEEWTKASDNKFKDVWTQHGAKLDEIQKDGKAAMELKKENEKEIEEKEKQAKKTEKEEKKAKPLFSEKFKYAYEMASTMLTFLIGDKVQDMIEKRCKKDSDKSYPPSDTPTEGGGPASCESNENNVYNGQFISKTELEDTCQYKVTYALAACSHQIGFTVQFQGAGSNENIEGGTLAQGQTLSRNRIITSSLCAHQRICIIVQGEDTKCFPPVEAGG